MASAMTKDATPAATPAMEIPVITPITACLRLARRYRDAMKNSKRMKRSRQASAFSLQLSRFHSRTVSQNVALPRAAARTLPIYGKLIAHVRFAHACRDGRLPLPELYPVRSSPLFFGRCSGDAVGRGGL